MSLRVWLPLNGDLENKGISDIEVINNGAIVDDNGKIGKCYSFGNNKYLKIENYATEFLTYNEFSLSVWFKCTAQNTAHSGSALISSGNWNQPANLLNLALGYFSSDHYTRLLVSGSGVWREGYSYNFYLNQWYNVVLTSGNGVVRAYVNGELIGDSYSAFKPESLEQTWICIGNGTYLQVFPFYGLMNDVRIYDHCLSQKEVKEISQGLVLHYKLDEDPKTINGIRNYLGNGYPFFDKPEKTDYTRSHLRAYSFYRSDSTVLSSDAGLNLVVDSNGIRYREIVFSATRDNTISYLYQLQHHWKYSGHEEFENNFNIWNDFQVGDYLTLSFEVWGNNYFKIGANDMDTHAVILNTKMTDSSSENLQFIPTAILFSSSEDLNKWHKISGTVQMTQNFYDCIHSADLAKFGFVFNISSIANVSIANQSITVRLRKLMLEKSDVAHEWTPAPEDLDIDITKVPDSSGYGNDGTIVGDISFLTDSSRYDISAYMNNTGTANHIEYNALDTSGAYTISFWIKAALSKNQVIFADKDHGYEFGILNNLFYTSTTSNKGWSTSKFITNNWNHIVIISQDGVESNVKLFVNGVEETSRTGASNWYAHNKTNPWLLNRGNDNTYAADASLSDFRFYVTALSAEDVAALYYIPAQIDDLGGVHAFEFEEETGGRELLALPWTTSDTNHTKTSLWENYNNKGEWTSNTKSSSSTDYIKITPDGNTYYYDAEISVAAGNQFYIGFERYDANKTSRSNNACVYVVAIKPTTDIVHQHYFGTVNLATDGTNPTDTITLRILNAWSGTTSDSTKEATIHHLSLREITGDPQTGEIKQQGQIYTDEFIEREGQASIYENGFVGGSIIIEK